MNMLNYRNIATNRCKRQCSWLCSWDGLCLIRSAVPVPVRVRTVSSAVGVRSGSHVSGADKLENQSHYLHCATVAQTDRHNYNYTCIHIIIIIIIIRECNTLWQRGSWWQSTNKTSRWESKNLLPQHLELGWHRVQRVGEVGSGKSALIRSTACIRNPDNLARQTGVKSRMRVVF